MTCGSLVASSFQSSSRWRSLPRKHPAAEVSAWKVTFSFSSPASDQIFLSVDGSTGFVTKGLPLVTKPEGTIICMHKQPYTVNSFHLMMGSFSGRGKLFFFREKV